MGDICDSWFYLESFSAGKSVLFASMLSFSVLFHVVSKLFTIPIHKLVSLWLLVELNLGSFSFRPYFFSRRMIFFTLFAIWVFVGILGGGRLGDLLRVMNFYMDAFLITLFRGFYIFLGSNNDPGLVFTSFYTFLEFDIEFLIQGVVVFEEDLLIEWDFLVVE